MAAQDISTGVITLKGSVDIVTEFFKYSVNNILYQRGVYPPESFKRVPMYGLSLYMTEDPKLSEYLQNVLQQLEIWLMNRSVHKLVLVIKSSDSGDTLERWVFNCEADIPDENSQSQSVKSTKPLKEVQQEIQAIMRQITASVTFLPLLDGPTCVDLLVYSNRDADVPATWADSDPCLIQNGEEVAFRSFSTKIHKVDLSVTFRVEEDGI